MRAAAYVRYICYDTTVTLVHPAAAVAAAAVPAAALAAAAAVE